MNGRRSVGAGDRDVGMVLDRGALEATAVLVTGNGRCEAALDDRKRARRRGMAVVGHVELYDGIETAWNGRFERM